MRYLILLLALFCGCASAGAPQFTPVEPSNDPPVLIAPRDIFVVAERTPLNERQVLATPDNPNGKACSLYKGGTLTIIAVGKVAVTAVYGARVVKEPDRRRKYAKPDECRNGQKIVDDFDDVDRFAWSRDGFRLYVHNDSWLVRVLDAEAGASDEIKVNVTLNDEPL